MWKWPPLSRVLQHHGPQVLTCELFSELQSGYDWCFSTIAQSALKTTTRPHKIYLETNLQGGYWTTGCHRHQKLDIRRFKSQFCYLLFNCFHKETLVHVDLSMSHLLLWNQDCWKWISNFIVCDWFQDAGGILLSSHQGEGETCRVYCWPFIS